VQLQEVAESSGREEVTVTTSDKPSPEDQDPGREAPNNAGADQKVNSDTARLTVGIPEVEDDTPSDLYVSDSLPDSSVMLMLRTPVMTTSRKVVTRAHFLHVFRTVFIQLVGTVVDLTVVCDKFDHDKYVGVAFVTICDKYHAKLLLAAVTCVWAAQIFRTLL
jgi:hypothetical protein